MTLGIGYQGRDFVELLTDSMDFIGPAATHYATLTGDKILWSGPRIAYVASGNLGADAPDIAILGVSAGARALRDWMRPYNREFDPTNGHGFYALVAGGPEGVAPSLCMIERLGPPRVAEIGDVFIIGSYANRAREMGMDRNVGELTSELASSLLLGLADMIVRGLYLEYGCNSLADFAVKMPGSVPTIAPPFHVVLINPYRTTQRTYQMET